jgi:hypothetical protein
MWHQMPVQSQQAVLNRTNWAGGFESPLSSPDVSGGSPDARSHRGLWWLLLSGDFEPGCACAAQLASLIRGHWNVTNGRALAK